MATSKPSQEIQKIQKRLWDEYCEKYPMGRTHVEDELTMKDFLAVATVEWLDQYLIQL